MDATYEKIAQDLHDVVDEIEAAATKLVNQTYDRNGHELYRQTDFIQATALKLITLGVKLHEANEAHFRAWEAL